jgi:hypothetical protein
MVSHCNTGKLLDRTIKILSNFYGKFLDALSCEGGPEVGIDSFQIQPMVKKDMALEASLFKNNDFLKFVIEK